MAKYDAIADEYVAWVAHEDPYSVMAVASHTLLAVVGSVNKLDVLDLACGEGHISRQLAKQARQVVGVDISERLLDFARQRTASESVRYLRDDAQVLKSFENNAFDVVVSNLALMDMPDLLAVYGAVRRVLREKRRFVFSITHPCFQSPHSEIITDAGGHFTARTISHYAVEGYWESDNKQGIRGQVGAYHRKLSTYLNGLLEKGFTIQRVVEPSLTSGDYDSAVIAAQVHLPSVMVIEAVNTADDGI